MLVKFFYLSLIFELIQTCCNDEDEDDDKVEGDEKEGIPVDVLKNVDVCVEIPQLGVIRSLNVHTSASINIWEYMQQHLKHQKR
ncbi:MAG: hypothetical protein EZS28_006312 [Streblomastix strix]|uniref:tRNA/rRNA methyltransferase SpoU type domain-containing protein n=1 Tax=Streblomastix strix TaxID=222440 RepID=A0A5J4WUA7_9EUKA|nr:MAG: hypothetical protein EZS28_006312 [Streblomastix strix]